MRPPSKSTESVASATEPPAASPSPGTGSGDATEEGPAGSFPASVPSRAGWLPTRPGSQAGKITIAAATTATIKTATAAAKPRLSKRRAAVPGSAGTRNTCRGASSGRGPSASADAARTSAASASLACRRSRFAIDRASSARLPRSRPNERLPTRAAVADLIVRHACSIRAPGSSVGAPMSAMAFACQTVSRSRRSARRAVRMLAPRLDAPAVDNTQSRQRLRTASQQRAHT